MESGGFVHPNMWVFLELLGRTLLWAAGTAAMIFMARRASGAERPPARWRPFTSLTSESAWHLCWRNVLGRLLAPLSMPWPHPGLSSSSPPRCLRC